MPSLLLSMRSLILHVVVLLLAQGSAARRLGAADAYAEDKAAYKAAEAYAPASKYEPPAEKEYEEKAEYAEKEEEEYKEKEEEYKKEEYSATDPEVRKTVDGGLLLTSYRAAGEERI